jgi:hypothetical protein
MVAERLIDAMAIQKSWHIFVGDNTRPSKHGQEFGKTCPK